MFIFEIIADSNLLQPETIKIQAIIEKTARFICEQGPQMEILIKAKQANNPLFDFLNQNGRLNPFYKHTLQAMKDGNYPSDLDRTEDNVPSSNPNTATGSLYQNYYSANQSMVGGTHSNHLNTMLTKSLVIFIFVDHFLYS